MANTLWVGADQAFHTISAAVSASQSGDTIYVEAGTYVNDWSAIDHDLNIIGVGGYAHLVSTEPIDNGKADLVVNGNVTVQNLEFSGANVGDHNGAGIRYESGNLTVLDSSFHDNQEGILAADNASGNITIQNSSFVHNGAGDGQSHGVYVGQIASLTVDGSSFSDQVDGNQLKSRAAETTVTNSHFVTGADGANYDIDLPNGGVASIHDDTFDKGVGTNNPAIIHYGGEIDNPVGSLSVDHNSFTSEISNATAVLNQTSLPVEMSDNTLANIANIELGGAASLTDNVDGAVSIGVVVDPSPATVDAAPPSSDSAPTITGSDPSSPDLSAATPTADPSTTDTVPATAATADPPTPDPAPVDPVADTAPAATSDAPAVADAGSATAAAPTISTDPSAATSTPTSDFHMLAFYRYLAGHDLAGAHAGSSDANPAAADWGHHDQPVTLVGAGHWHGDALHH
jgi:hypothetical protein